MLKLKKIIFNKLDSLFSYGSKKYRKYNTCLYKVTEYIEKGSQGKIFKGHNRITKNEVAIKIIKEYDQDYIKNERKFHNLNIRHRNIVKYRNLFYKNNNLHIIMNYYPQDLYGYFTENDFKMDEYKTKVVIKQLIDALYHLSQNKLYHTDIKLENIALKNENDLTKIKLIDFSNYIMINDNVDYVKIPPFEYGTLEYIAPELLMLKFYKTSDVWSIGVLIYLLLTKTFILEEQHSISNINQIIIDEKINKLNNLENPISKDFYQLIWLMFRVNPLERITLKELKDKII